MAALVIWPHGGTELTKKMVRTENGAKTTARIIQATDDVSAMLAIDSDKPATVTVDGVLLVFDELKLKHFEADVYDADLSYVHPDKQDNKEDKENEAPTLSFSTTGGQKHITHSYETLRSYPDPSTKDLHQQAIGFEQDAKGKIKIHGTDVTIPACKLTVSAKIAQPANPFDFGRTIARCTGRTNNSDWNGFKRGELLCLGGKLTGKFRDKWTVDYEFDCSEEITEEDNFFIGPACGPIRKEGHAHLWVKWKQGFTGGTGDQKPTAIVDSVFIERIYHEFSLSTLGL